MLNRAKSAVMRKTNFATVMEAVPLITVASYSTGTVSVAANSSQVTGVGTVFTSAMVGRKIKIGSDPVSYIILKYTDATHIDIDIPLSHAAQSGVTYTIFQDTYSLSPRLSSVSLFRIPRTNDVIQRKPKGFLSTRYSDPMQSTGYPEVFAITGNNTTQEGSYTATAGTTSTSLVYASLTYASIQNYYKDWIVYNSTRSLSARVTAYDRPTTALTLERPITGQSAGDSFVITKSELSIQFAPTPLSVYNIVADGYRASTLFANDTDYETEIDPDNEDVLIFEALANWYRNRDKDRYAIFEAEAVAIYKKMADRNIDMGVSPMSFSGGKMNRSRNDPFQDTFVRHELF
jgi:hypothetical protein